tara:strand:- start:107 stop:1054 length:948 start_codon:yes stop_codon:yes gene_type:complete
MTDNNTNTDTQNQEKQYQSLEEAAFDNQVDSGSDLNNAFTTGEEGSTSTSAPQGQPDNASQGTEENTLTANNDQTRYQYWQSQADKYKNELEAMQQQTLQQQQYMQQQQMQAPQAQAPQEESFPEPPSRPTQPSGFSREEAYNDSSSSSARYMDELERWRDDMNEYNTLKTQYQTALVDEKLNYMQRERQEEIQRAQANQQLQNEQLEVINHVQGHYGMNQEEAVDFMEKMSNPNAITVDNLVQLYRMQQGNAAPQQNPAPAQPSPVFNQVQNAQQVPSPMGVMPSGNTNTDGRSIEDKMIDTMIGNFNSKNPWK